MGPPQPASTCVLYKCDLIVVCREQVVLCDDLYLTVIHILMWAALNEACHQSGQPRNQTTHLRRISPPKAQNQSMAMSRPRAPHPVQPLPPHQPVHPLEHPHDRAPNKRGALHGIIRRYLTASSNIHPLDVPKLDLLAIMRARPVINDTSPTIDLNFNAGDNYVPKYMDMHDNDGYPEIMVAHHLSWTAIGLITVLCILCIITIVWLYKRRQKIRFFFADALLSKVKAKRVEKAIKYNKEQPETVNVIEDVESATGDLESV